MISSGLLKVLLVCLCAPAHSRFFSLPTMASRDGACANKAVTFHDLEQKVVSLFEKAGSLPVRLSKDGGNIEVRTDFEGQNMVSLAEAKVIGRPPSAFRGFLENFNDAFAQNDPMVREIRHLEHDKSREGIKAFLQFPAPVSDRIMVHWKYLGLDRRPDEHMLILSEEGNGGLLDKHLSTEEKQKYVLARTFLCAYWVSPVSDAQGNVVGSNIKYAYSGDVGGSIPARVQRWIGPKNSLDSLKVLIGYSENSSEK